MYILQLFEAVYVSHVKSLEKKGLECVLKDKTKKKKNLNYRTRHTWSFKWQNELPNTNVYIIQ